MKQSVTQGIVLSRTDFGEADRIVTFLTPDNGKLRLMARGSRRVKSKLAGGIELFSISDLTYLAGRRDIGTLISARLNCHFGRIVADIERVQLGYEILKRLNRVTEDHPEPEYFELLSAALAGLDDDEIAVDTLGAWFEARLLSLSGHAPNLRTDASGQPLAPDDSYNFDFDRMAFTAAAQGSWQADHIKVLRLLFGSSQAANVARVRRVEPLINDLRPLLRNLTSSH